MDDNRLYRYYQSSGYGWNAVVYNFLISDKYLRTLFHLGPYCGAITTITCFLFVVIVTYAISSWAMFLINTKKFNELHFAVEEKLPRKENILQVRPAYNCLNKHLQQIAIFLNKTKKVIYKEQLEVEIMNSRINTMIDLLNPEKSQWDHTRSPKGYFRDVYTPPKK
ncbi:PREDICTED: uncharacterized protein LOC105364748 [Ceratosolen solmsi marchali]|uniref:Uncharacterized protein LOC105364748 n=1 Tax=Ceratosolen solmsi marchali TaxID=326594 RepID=A0AAJ7DYG8_9HYME|nr:PREDICTED: uncharacterized protein LOC105364748 [Ceratosolen solmsi marchali]